MTASDHASRSLQEDRLWPAALLCILLIVAELYALFFDLGGNAQRGVQDTSPPIATLRRGFNEVRSRSAGTITWNIPSSGAEFRRKDAVLTMSDARAFVEFTDGSLMTVEPDSLVVLEKSDATATPKIMLRLLEGTVARSSAGHLPVAIDLGTGADGKASVVEDPTGKAVFRLRREHDSVKLEVDEGQVEIASNGQTQKLGSFQNATISPGAVKVVEVPLRFANLSPDGGRMEARQNGDQRIGLSWNLLAPGQPLRSLEAKVVVSRHSDLSEPKEADVKDNQATFEPEGDGAYFWRVVSKDGDVRSGVASFTVLTKSAPKARSPGDGDDALVGQNVVFRWDPARGARVFLETSSTSDFVSSNRLDPPEGRDWIEARYDSPRTIYWRLRADYGKDAGTSSPGETRKLTVRTRPLLKAPKGVKSRIKIETSQRSLPPRVGFLSWLFALLEPEARAEEPPAPAAKHLVVELEWQPVEGAKSYRLQLSDTADFSKPIVDRQVRDTKFDYRTEPSRKSRTLYFRVAGIDETGTHGEFSDTDTVEIEATRPEPPKRKVEVARPPERIVPARSPFLLSTDERASRERFHLLLTGGAAYHSRSFKSTTTPMSVAGSGLIPAFGGLELRRWLGVAPERIDQSASSGLALGVSLLAEKAEPSTAGVMKQSLSIPLLRGWFVYEFPLWGAWAGVGPYGTTTQKFSWTGTTPVATRQIALGLTGMLTSSQVEQRSWHWRLQAAAIGAGAKGADAGGFLRHYFAGPVRAADRCGAFWQGEGMVRYFDIETSYAAILELGYAF